LRAGALDLAFFYALTKSAGTVIGIKGTVMLRSLSVVSIVLGLALPGSLRADPNSPPALSQTTHVPRVPAVNPFDPLIDEWEFDSPRNPGPAKKVTITVELTDTDVDKAIKLEAAIKAEITDPELKLRVKRNGATVTLPKEFNVFKKTNDKSKELVQAGANRGAKKDEKGVKSNIDYHGPASGIDYENLLNSSFFSASFGYDGFSIASTIHYNELATPDAHGVLTAMYSSLLAQLPPTMQPDLTLDLMNGSIFFLMDDMQTNYFVTNDSNDSTIGFTGGMEFLVPEPSTLAFALMLGMIFVARRHERPCGTDFS
jgi:hypothetical protein